MVSRMTTKSCLAFAISAGVALGVAALGSDARADEGSASPGSSTRDTPASGQQRVADATWMLESAFNDQFVRGTIDRDALAQPIHDVLEAMPEAARPKVQAHIETVLDTAEKLASQMTPEERAAAVLPPVAEKIGKTEQAQIYGWGWPSYGGWGGYGAFGFPGMYGLGYGLGWGGLGLGGWYW
jgi:hypothetical protein